MKKFALTAVAVALFSGSAFAGEVEQGVVIPQGYTVTNVADEAGNLVKGVVAVKNGDDVITYHVLNEDTIMNGVMYRAADDEIVEKAQTDINNWAKENNLVPVPVPGTGAVTPGLPEGGQEIPNSGNGNGDVPRPMPPVMDGTNDDNVGHTPMPGFGQDGGKTNIEVLGEAFVERVDAVNGYLSQAGNAITNNSAAIQNNSDRITNLESAFEQQAAHTAKEISRLDDRIDGIGAMSQAVTAARPQLFGNQTSAIGMGIGHMGDATALAAGYVHRINENWSANANISTTFGTDDRDTSVGAGVAYAW